MNIYRSHFKGESVPGPFYQNISRGRGLSLDIVSLLIQTQFSCFLFVFCTLHQNTLLFVFSLLSIFMEIQSH